MRKNGVERTSQWESGSMRASRNGSRASRGGEERERLVGDMQSSERDVADERGLGPDRPSRSGRRDAELRRFRQRT
ncbi:hypothetical protein Syun_004783 [Stephania yunnanensis]|uniref:Uncharacterized protein n=1 Tax=Stephania yunnanensis TaxID=152371 RepID=A0AAP0L3W4_9MAGN